MKGLYFVIILLFLGCVSDENFQNQDIQSNEEESVDTFEVLLMKAVVNMLDISYKKAGLCCQYGANYEKLKTTTYNQLLKNYSNNSNKDYLLNCIIRAETENDINMCFENIQKYLKIKDIETKILKATENIIKITYTEANKFPTKEEYDMIRKTIYTERILNYKKGIESELYFDCIIQAQNLLNIEKCKENEAWNNLKK